MELALGLYRTPTKTPAGQLPAAADVQSLLRSPLSPQSLPGEVQTSPAGGRYRPRSALSERFVPSRPNKARCKIDFNLSPEVLKRQRSSAGADSTGSTGSSGSGAGTADENCRPLNTHVYSALLANELLGDGIDYLAEAEAGLRYGPVSQGPARTGGAKNGPGGGSAMRRLRYRSTYRYRVVTGQSGSAGLADSPLAADGPSNPFSLSPLSSKSQRLLLAPRKPLRKIAKVPYKVLDAPDLQDDFYLNLVDWSSQNTLAVGLGYCVYLWSAETSQVTKLCDLQENGESVTSVSWAQNGQLCAVGTHDGRVELWDVKQLAKVGSSSSHQARVGSLAWSQNVVASGSRDRTILLRDVRAPAGRTGLHRRLSNHRQEVCGLKWSPDLQHLASGSNDNRLLVWPLQQTTDGQRTDGRATWGRGPLGQETGASSGGGPVHAFEAHRAAVKAIAWSPHQHGLLASGGGTQDKQIRFWNTLTGQPLAAVDTGSQVCNLAWCAHSNEFVSTHGYNQNQIVVWKYPRLGQLARLTGHNTRVLYLALSPDGDSVVTGAGDETLRFWNVFQRPPAAQPALSASSMNMALQLR